MNSDKHHRDSLIKFAVASYTIHSKMFTTMQFTNFDAENRNFSFSIEWCEEYPQY